jgi:hypothetical protein
MVQSGLDTNYRPWRLLTSVRNQRCTLYIRGARRAMQRAPNVKRQSCSRH